MASGSGFYKGEKKKPKKNKADKKGNISVSDAPTFKLPELIRKQKNQY